MYAVNGNLMSTLAYNFDGQSPYQTAPPPGEDGRQACPGCAEGFWSTVEEVRLGSSQIAPMANRPDPEAAVEASLQPATAQATALPRIEGAAPKAANDRKDAAVLPMRIRSTATETENEVLERSLRQVLLRWQVDHLPGECCSWHSMVQLALFTLRRLQRGPCERILRVHQSQCTGCRLYLPRSLNKCDMCAQSSESGQQQGSAMGSLEGRPKSELKSGVTSL